MSDAKQLTDSFSKFPAERLFAVVGLVVVGFLYREELVDLEPAKWATVSGWLFLLVGIVIAQQLELRFEQMLRRLNKRHALTLNSNDFELLLEKLRFRGTAAAFVGGILLPLILAVAYGLVFNGSHWKSMMPMERVFLVSEIGLELVAAMIVGRYLGRGIFYGFLGKQLAIDGVRVNMIYGHSDQAAGLRPIGDFYFFQATVTALPVMFFAFWVLMIPVWSTLWPNTDSGFGLRWKNTYLVFFFLAIGAELLSFVLPLWFFHQEMARQKKRLIPRADELTAELSLSQRGSDLENGDLNNGAIEPSQLLEQIELIESLPTWPLAPEVRNRFAWGNLAFLAPPAAKMSQTVMEAFSASVPG